MKARLATALAFAWSMAACLAQGGFDLRSPQNHRVTINAPANWYSGTFSTEVWELNAHSIPPTLNTVASLSPIAAYSLLVQDGFQLEQTFVNQTCNNGYFSLGEVDMWGAWAYSTVVIALVAWNTAAPGWNAMLAEADSNTRAGVIAWTQYTVDYTDITLPEAYGTDAWNQDLVLMPVVSPPISPPTQTQAQDFTYTTNNGAITITGYTGPLASVVIPSAIQGLPVVSIGSYAFYSRPGLKNVSIPAGVTNIENLAFYGCMGLTMIFVDALNSSYASAGGVLFDKPLTTLIQCPGGRTGDYAIPEGVTNIAANAFAVCPGLTDVTMPDSLITIGNWAFFDCTGLASVAIPENVTSIGDQAFLDCTSLTNVLIGNRVISVGSWTFAFCTGLTEAAIADSVSNIGDDAFYACSNLESVTIPNSVTNIGDNAFCACSNLKSVTIPNSVTDIGRSAFADCTNLTGITIPGSVMSIGTGALSNCASLAAITVDAANPVYSSVGGVLFNKSQTMLIIYPDGKAGSYVIPSTVISIGDWAFDSCTRLVSVTIPDSATSMGINAFANCGKLTNVTIGNRVTSIANDAFANCGILASVAVGNSVTNIGYNAFLNCGSLTSVTIPRGVSSIGDQAFDGCASLADLTIPDSVTSIGEGAFSGSGLTRVTIPNSVISMGAYAFLFCQGLTNVTIGTNVTNIGNGTFDECGNLATVTIGNSVTNIGQDAFYDCIRLVGVYFNGNAPSVGWGGFAYDYNATAYYLPGTTGWASSFAALPAALWHPLVQTSDANFGVRTNQFGFTINWASGRSVVVEASTSLNGSNWVPLQTNTLVNGSFYFSDPQWTNYPARFYRIRSP